MGLLDTLLGRTKPTRPDLDALFALPSAAVTLQSAAGLVSTGQAGVCWKPPAGRPVEDVQREITELLDMPDDPTATTQSGGGSGRSGSGDTSGTGGTGGTGEAVVRASDSRAGSMTQSQDSFGYRWLLLEDADLDQLVARVHLVNSTLTDNGWGPQLLCSVFGMTPGPDAGSDAKAFFLVYLYKRGTFYPFVPDGKEHRDSEYELWVRSSLGGDLPVEGDLTRWFPLWDLPLRSGARGASG